MIETKPIVEFRHVNKAYSNGKQALSDISLNIYPGEFVCLIGTSGAGKTTTMRMINRMLLPTSGKVLVAGHNVAHRDPIELRRRIGYVIQNIGLIPHMTLEENIELVPRLLKWPKEKRRKRARQLMKLVELPESYLSRYPNELSGGQQQRVGVIRALAADQQIILMDEPFGALDPLTRERLQALVKRLQQDMGTTIIMITHDMNEALSLATKLVVMDQGRIVQMAPPAEIIEHPANDFVRSLIGEQRLAEARAALSTAKSVMSKPITIAPEADLVNAIAQMRNHHVDSLLVVDDEKHLLGVIDIANLMGKDQQKDLHVEDIMKKEVQTVLTTDPLKLITRPLLAGNLKYIPVVDHDHVLAGIITRTTLANILYDQVWGSHGITHQFAKQLTSKAGDRS